MKMPILASVIVFVIWLAYKLHKSNNADAHSQDAFWEREARADATARKPLDDVEYISIPLDLLPVDTMKDDPRIAEYLERLRFLSNEKIANFTGISNTDLKLRYGAPNIESLMRCDQNYTVLARTLQEWAQLLYENGHTDDAETVLRYAVSTRTDVSGTYRLISEIYKSRGDYDSIRSLLPVAEKLNSAMKPHIIDILMGYYTTTPVD
jgi:hypothetical protein